MPESGQPAPDWPRQPADGTPEPAVAAGGTDQFGWPGADGDGSEPQWPTVELPSPDGVKKAEQAAAPVLDPDTVEQPAAATEAEKPAETPAEPAAKAEPSSKAAPTSKPAESGKSDEPAKPAAQASEPDPKPAAKAEQPATKPEQAVKPAAKPEPVAKPDETAAASTPAPSQKPVEAKPQQPSTPAEPAASRTQQSSTAAEPAASRTQQSSTAAEPAASRTQQSSTAAEPAVSRSQQSSTPAGPAASRTQGPSTPPKSEAAEDPPPAKPTPPADQSSTPARSAEPGSLFLPAAKPEPQTSKFAAPTGSAGKPAPTQSPPPASPNQQASTPAGKPGAPAEQTSKFAVPAAQPVKPPPMKPVPPTAKFGAPAAKPGAAPPSPPAKPGPPARPAGQPGKPTPAQASPPMNLFTPQVAPPPKPAGPPARPQPPERPAEQTTQFAAVKPPAPSREPETLRIKLADVPVQVENPLEDTVAIPVDNERARLDPPTVQLPNPADLRRGDDTPTIQVRMPRPPAAGRPELGDDVPQPAPQLPPPPRVSEENGIDEPAPRRSRKPLFIGLAVVLVIVLGGGIYFGAGGFGSGGPTAIATSPPPTPSVPNELLKPLSNGATPSAAGLAAALTGPASSPALGTLTGTVIDPATGSTLWDHNSTTPLTPASSGKLLTMTAALLSLDPQFRFTTKVVAGPDPSTVILVGGGDPTLSSLPDGKETVYPGAAHLDDLVDQVKKATGGAAQKVLLDTSRYAGDPMAPGWENSDIAGGSVAPITPIMLDGGRGKPTVSETGRTATPDTDAAKEFAKRLGADPNSVAKTTAPADAKVLGSVQSPPLTDMITNLLQISDNVLAEAVGREVAKQAGAETSFAGGSSTVLNILRNNNFDLTGVTMVDGSGLSTQDRVTAKLLSSIMAVAAGPDGGSDPRVAKLRPLLTGLPVAGGSGTLSDRYNDAASSPGKGWVRAKTGTLDGVNTLTGIVQDTDGKVLAFALMSNGSQIDQGRAALDDVAAALRGCGCR